MSSNKLLIDGAPLLISWDSAEFEALPATTEGCSSTSLICRVAGGNIDLVHAVPIALRFAENCAMVPLHIDPRYLKLIFLGVAAKAKGNRIADRDPRRQTDVLISPAGRGNKQIATFGQYSRSARCDGLDLRGHPPALRADRPGSRPHADNRPDGRSRRHWAD